MRRARRAAPCLALVLAVLSAPACGGDSSDPGSAKDCRELVERASVTAKKVLKSIEGKTVEDLERDNPTDPFKPMTDPFEAFKVRAQELGCDEGELRRLACVAYQDLKPTGPAAERYLATVVATCQ